MYKRKINTVAGCQYHCCYVHCPMVYVCQYASLEEMCKGWGWPSRVQPTRGYHQEAFYEGSFLKMLFNKVEGMMEQVQCCCLLCPVFFFQWSSTSSDSITALFVKRVGSSVATCAPFVVPFLLLLN